MGWRRRSKIAFTHLNARVYAASGGRVGGSFGGHRVLLLTTTGRRTGRARRTPVQFELVDGSPVIAAVGGGSPAPPSWCVNLRACGAAEVQIGRERFAAHAVEVAGDDRSELWRELCRRNPAVERAAARAGREIPLFRLIREAAR